MKDYVLPGLFDDIPGPEIHEVPVCAFCGGDASASDHHMRCDGRQGKVHVVEPFNPRDAFIHGVTRSTAEAMALLRLERRRLINLGVDVAVELIRRDGSTHSRAVLQEMEQRGLVRDPTIKDFWLGAVFHRSRFRWTGEWFTYSDDSTNPHGKQRNIHERTVRVWTLNADRLANGS